MATAADQTTLASQARRLYTEELVKGLAAVVNAAAEQARSLLDKPSEHVAQLRRRDGLIRSSRFTPSHMAMAAATKTEE